MFETAVVFFMRDVSSQSFRSSISTLRTPILYGSISTLRTALCCTSPISYLFSLFPLPPWPQYYIAIEPFRQANSELNLFEQLNKACSTCLIIKLWVDIWGSSTQRLDLSGKDCCQCESHPFKWLYHYRAHCTDPQRKWKSWETNGTWQMPVQDITLIFV